MNDYTLLNIILVLLLASLSFLISPNSIIVEARKFATSNGVFKVDLIHRDSPLSPNYKRAPLGFKSDAKLYALKASGGGGYLMRIALGTPKVEILALADTGSDLIWLQCLPCNTTNTCFPHKSPLFDQTKSSTYHIIPCTSSKCTPPDIYTNCTLNNNNNTTSSSCAYQYSYGSYFTTNGILATETITIPSFEATSSISLSSSTFGCGIDQPHFRFGNLGEGIIGLGAGPSSLISQLGPKINYKFSYCLAPLSSRVSSKLTFGVDVTGPKVVSTPFKIGLVETQPTFYNLTLNGISLSTRDKNKTVQVKLNPGLGTIIDSGTTITMLPINTYTSLKYNLKSAIGHNPVPSPMEDYDLCYNTSLISGQQFSPPDVVFQFQGADVVLKVVNTFQQFEGNVSCLAMKSTGDDTSAIFGNIAQLNFEIGYDLKAKKVSFAPTYCTKY